ncbi:MAG: iron-containing redox enzyme family protein [Lautropia sp.]|nr:iron-containing redox enzyme family protein [Lautropia sp.]
MKSGVKAASEMMSFEDKVFHLSLDGLIDWWCAQGKMSANSGFEVIDTKIDSLSEGVFSRNDLSKRAEFHRSLLKLYDMHVSLPSSGGGGNNFQFDVFLIHVKNRLEDEWLRFERRCFLDFMERLGGEKGEGVVDLIGRMWLTHPSSRHPLFSYLEREADIEKMCEFFVSDSPLNVRFYDLIVLSMVGAPEDVRVELAGNFWDESGRGDAGSSHVSLFKALLDKLGIERAADEHASLLSLEGMEGYNLFMMTALNRRLYYMLLGVMAITELMDPSQYERLVNGCRRLGLSDEDILYYSEHVTIDVVHGEGWLKNVIFPIVSRCPSAAGDVLFGAYLRLKTCQSYYDALLFRLKEGET